MTPHRKHAGRIQRRVVTLLLIAFTAGGWLAGCARGMSDAARGQVTYTGSFTALQKAPEDHRGQVALLGGRIIETTPKAEGTEIVVLQLPLSSSDKPDFDRPSEGRFLILSEDFLDPAAYPQLTAVTVVGEVAGHTIRTIGDYPYSLPILRPIEIKTWPSQGWGPRSPGFHLGVGAGSRGGGAGVGISF